jgi:hypothetical protein
LEGFPPTRLSSTLPFGPEAHDGRLRPEGSSPKSSREVLQVKRAVSGKKGYKFNNIGLLVYNYLARLKFEANTQ